MRLLLGAALKPEADVDDIFVYITFSSSSSIILNLNYTEFLSTDTFSEDLYHELDSNIKEKSIMKLKKNEAEVVVIDIVIKNEARN